MSNPRIIKVRPWMAEAPASLIVGGWFFVSVQWWPMLFAAPLMAALTAMVWGLRSRAMAVRFWILIPAERFGTDRVEFTIAHGSVHIRQQKELGFIRYMLKRLTPMGCVRLEAEAYSENIRLLMEGPWRRSGQPDVLSYRSTLLDHYAKTIKAKYPQVRWSKVTEADVRAVLETFNRARAA